MSVDVRRSSVPWFGTHPRLHFVSATVQNRAWTRKRDLNGLNLKMEFSRISPTLLSLKQTIANSWFLIVRIGWFAVPPTNPAGCLDGIQSNTNPRSTVDRQRHTLGLGRSWNRSWNKGLGNHLWYSRSPFQTLCVCVCVFRFSHISEPEPEKAGLSETSRSQITNSSCEQLLCHVEAIITVTQLSQWKKQDQAIWSL